MMIFLYHSSKIINGNDFLIIDWKLLKKKKLIGLCDNWGLNLFIIKNFNKKIIKTFLLHNLFKFNWQSTTNFFFW